MAPRRSVVFNIRNVRKLAVGTWWDRTLPGFYLSVAAPGKRYPDGVRSWGVWYRVRGRACRSSLGRLTAVSLGAARDRAREILEAAKLRRIDLQRAPSATLDLATLITRWLEATAPRCAPRTVLEYRQTMDRHVLPSRLAKIPLADLRRGDVRDLLAPLAATAPTTAVNVHRRLRSVFRWGVREELIDRDPTAALDPPARLESRERVLSDVELVALWLATEDELRGGRVKVVARQRAALARLLLLLAQRSGETAAMRWADLQLDEKAVSPSGAVWLIPAGHRKGIRGKKRAHAVPLPELALQTIEDLRPLTGKDVALPSRSGTDVRTSRVAAPLEVLGESLGQDLGQGIVLHPGLLIPKREVSSLVGKVAVEPNARHVAAAFLGVGLLLHDDKGIRRSHHCQEYSLDSSTVAL